MGVKDLWKLLETTGRPVTLESLEGLVLAVDVSIWLNQAVKGARDAHGNPLPHAHLLVLFNRICKLLYYHIKPVFVFDGATPTLKKMTLAARSQKRDSAHQRSLRTADKQLTKFLQAKILEQMTGQKSSVPAPMSAVMEPDMFELPALPGDALSKQRSPSTDRSDLETSFSHNHAYLHEVASLNINSSEFGSLPAEVQHELLLERQQMEKYSYNDPATLPQMASDFSNYQLSKLMQRSRTSQKLADVRKVLKSSETAVIGLSEESKVHEVEASRIMSSDTAHYILVKGRELESSSQEDSLSQSSMEFPAIGELESDMDWRREEEEEEKIVEKEEGVEEEEEEEEEQEEKAVTESGWGVVESEPHKEEEETVELQESAATVCKPLSFMATSEQREEEASFQDRDCSNLQVEPTVSAMSEEVTAIPQETSSLTVSVIASESERETTRDKCSLTSVVSSASEMQATPREKEKCSPVAYASASEGLPSSQPCEKLREVGEVLRDGRSFVEEGVEEERGLHLEEQLDKEGEKEGEKEERVEEREKEEGEKEERVEEREKEERVEEREKEEGEKEEGEKEERVEEREKEEGRTPEQSVTISSSVKVSPCQFEKDNSASHLEDKESAEADEHKEQTVTVNHHSVGESVDSASLRTDHLKRTQVVQLVESEEEGVRGGVTTVIDQSEVRMLEDQVGYISDSESDEMLVGSNSETTQPDSRDTKMEPEVSPSGLEWREEEREEWPGGKEVEALLQLAPEEAQSRLQSEAAELGRERAQQSREAAGISSLMYRDVQELLSLFGLPYIVSPTEAEAQCAALDVGGLTQGTITDDSDVFLFGGERVYRHFFSQNKSVESYSSKDVEIRLGLTRDHLIVLAYLLGSDYVEGVEGVGVVSAMELLRDFPGDGLEPLRKFREWHTNVNSKPALTMKETSQQKKLRQLSLPPSFPDEAVRRAYISPEVDDSSEKFEWGKPDLDLLRKFAQDRMGWGQSKVDDILLPVLKRMNSRESQRKITQFLPMTPSPSKSQTIKSKRLRNVVTRLTHTAANQGTATTGRRGCAMKRKRTDLSSSGSSSGSDDTVVKDDRLSGGVEESKAASEGVLKQERRGGGGGGGRWKGGGGRGRGGRKRGGRGNKQLTSKGKTAGDVELSASSSSSDAEFDSIVRSLEDEDLKLLGDCDDSSDHEQTGREEETVHGGLQQKEREEVQRQRKPKKL